MMLRHIFLLIGVLVLASCKHQPADVAPADKTVSEREDLEAKQLLQGIWMDYSTDDAAFRAVGDTIYYPDAASQPNHFRFLKDSLELGNQRYPVLKQSEAVFWFQNQAGDTVKFYKSDTPDDSLYFVHRQPEILTVTDVIKKDSVVLVGGQRYHWYIAINPTTYRVRKTGYTSEGVAVDNVYFDNIIHISLFQGTRQVFSQDFGKRNYAAEVPDSFLEQAILGNMQYSHADAKGFHFNATICIPDGASCYMVDTCIGLNGQLSLKLLEY